MFEICVSGFVVCEGTPMKQNLKIIFDNSFWDSKQCVSNYVSYPYGHRGRFTFYDVNSNTNNIDFEEFYRADC